MKSPLVKQSKSNMSPNKPFFYVPFYNNDRHRRHDLYHDDIYENGRLRIDSAYWQPFLIPLYQAKPHDTRDSDRFLPIFVT
jgi:hypothetical protein